MSIKVIRSANNAKLRSWRKLATSKERRKQQKYLVEGTHLVEEALKHQVAMDCLIMTESYYAEQWDHLQTHDQCFTPVLIADSLASQLAQTPSPQGIFAVIEVANDQNLPLNDGNKYLLVDRIQDPGNLGTMIRTADAAGIDAIILGEGCVDLYNDKVVRSTQGSLWHLPIVTLSLEEAIPLLQQHDIQVYGTGLDFSAVPYYELDTQNSCAWLMGNEGQGVDPKLLGMCDQVAYIPMQGQAESLNVAIATAIFLFQANCPK